MSNDINVILEGADFLALIYGDLSKLKGNCILFSRLRMAITDEEEVIVVVNQLINNIKLFLLMFMHMYLRLRRRRLTSNRDSASCYSLIGRAPKQYDYLQSLVGLDDTTCRDNLRMNIATFQRLCYVLENIGGLKPNRNVEVVEQIAIFLQILGHHTKIVVVRGHFKRSSYTISKYFNRVLIALLKLHSILLITPTPITEDSENERWKYFKGTLGALDGTYIDVRVSKLDKPRYRNRKGQVTVNVLAVCDENMNFIYLLTRWEGSAADSRVLRDAVGRTNGFRVPTGNYYLVDSGYTIAAGFLAPYRNTRYHLREFGEGRSAPQSYKEFFNSKHAKARNIIERAFGLLKSRWGILRSHAFYPIKIQNRIIMACYLIHNFIRTTHDNVEEPNWERFIVNNDDLPKNDTHIGSVEITETWTTWRDEIAINMYNEWRLGV